ncbi:hypothetical protein H2199_006109 [Coniosporium tulheliwenetii]|uniref:Uncharacterized protein n=1 Tax=Coniosporium tulheliwenetii TaxID=3383036 RepID=A0ACC2YXH7_9PEZI|nr:hypothetical protein H2199_006109 [Cladosporium sp. JES 115]
MAPARIEAPKTYKEDSSEPSSPRRLAASQESVDTATFYAARAILDENKTKYRIDWEPNPCTGEVYEPTWEPKGFVTKDLVEEWKKLKKQTPNPGSGTRARSRVNLVDAHQDAPLFKPQDAPESTAEPSPAPAPLNQEHKVEISQPTDFDPDDYSKYSSSAIRASSPHSSQFITPKPTQTVSGSNVTSVFTPHAPTSLSARVIPDTLEVPGSSSFVLSSQQDSASKANGTSQVVPISAFESSARAPDSDPEPSSPALPDKVVDCVPESPSQTASSVSSPPPPETPDKSQSQSQSRSEHVATQQSQRSHQEPNGGAGSAGTREAEAQVQPNPREGHQEVRSLKAQGLARGEDAKASGTGSALKESAAELRTEAADSPATTTNSPTQERQPTNEEQEQATGPAAPADRERPGTDELNGARADPVTGSLGEGFGQEGGSSSILKEKDPNPVRERSVNPLEKPIQEHPFSSSPLPPAPSQGLDLFASNPPPLVETPSEMATPTKTRSGETPGSTSSSSGFRESLKQMRTTVRARHAAIARAEVESSPKVQTTSAAAVAQDITSSESATRSPSVVPSTNNATRSEIPAAPEHEEPDRLHTLEEAAAEPVPAPPIIVEPEEPGQPEVSSNRVILDEPPLGPMEYIIPLPLEGPQGDQYRRTITYYKDLIENSARSGWNGEDPPTKDVKHFVTRIHNVATHVDLENQDALTQQGIRPENQAEWDQSCSVKFSCIAQLRLEAGKLPDDYPRPFTAAEEVARYVAEHEAEWPLPAIGGFKDLVEFDEPLPQFSVPSSVPAGTQEISGHRSGLCQAAQNSSVIAQPPSYPHAEAATSTDSSDLDVENDVSTLRALVISNRNRCSDLETELAALQYRFETLRTEHGALKRGRDDAVLALAAANAKNGTQAAAIVALKAERVELMQKLEEARKLLEGSSVPEIAQLAALENSKQAAEERAAKWERKFAALEKERDFFSSTYQTASQAASELRTQNNDLEKSVTDLAKRASGEAARLKQLGADQRAKKYEKEVARLKLMVRNLEELVRKKDEDLRAMKGRSGYGTRQSSVPRSPSVRPSRGSRANSPLAGVGE